MYSSFSQVVPIAILAATIRDDYVTEQTESCVMTAMPVIFSVNTRHCTLGNTHPFQGTQRQKKLNDCRCCWKWRNSLSVNQKMLTQSDENTPFPSILAITQDCHIRKVSNIDKGGKILGTLSTMMQSSIPPSPPPPTAAFIINVINKCQNYLTMSTKPESIKSCNHYR